MSVSYSVELTWVGPSRQTNEGDMARSLMAGVGAAVVMFWRMRRMKGAWLGSLKKALKAGLALGAERSRRAGCRLRIRDEYWFMRLLVRVRQFMKVRLLLWVRSKCTVRGVSLGLWEED